MRATGPDDHWTCTACDRTYPIDYGPDRCTCGGALTRTLLTIWFDQEEGEES